MMYRTKTTLLLLLLGITLLGLAACDRVGRAPEDLDVTPTAIATSTPAPTPTPTPLPEGETAAAPEVDEVQARLDAILEEIPDKVNAGAVQWARGNKPGFADVRIEDLPNLKNGRGFRVFFNEQIGGQANLSYAIFDSPEDAKAHFDFTAGIRAALKEGEGKPNDSLPQPNLLGGSTQRGLAAIFQKDEFFIEVYIEAFSSTSGDPLVPLARQALGFLDAGIANYATPDQTVGRIAALQTLVPDQLELGDITWFRESADVAVVEGEFEKGLGARTRYQTAEGSAADVTIVVFDTPELMAAAYTRQLSSSVSETNSFTLTTGEESADLPTPNQYKSSSLRGERAVIQVGGIYFMDIAVFSESGADVFMPLAQALVDVINESASTYEAGQ